jgi:hypothetical protein
LLSFILFINIYLNNPEAAFYLLPSRFWEIGMGACSAIYLFNHKPSYFFLHKKDIILFFSCVLLLLPMLAINLFINITWLPNLLVCMGTVLIIIFADNSSFLGKFLSSRLFVLIGLLSYSLYLWHQPLYAFLRISSLEEPNIIYFILCFFLSFPIAFFSWKLEIFFRKEASLKLLTSFLGIGISFVLIVGAIFTSTIGFYNHYEELNSTYMDNTEYKFSNPDRDFLISAANNLDDTFSNPNLKNLVILGDSYASDLINMIKVNNFFQDYELVKPKYNCVNYNEIDQESSMILEQSDLILITYRYLENGGQKLCLEKKIEYLESLEKRYLLIGPKDFGFNINAPLRRKIYDFKSKPVIKII